MKQPVILKTLPMCCCVGCAIG